MLSPEMFHRRLSDDKSRGHGCFFDCATSWPISEQMQRDRADLFADWLDWIAPHHALWSGNQNQNPTIPPAWVDASRRCHEEANLRILGAPFDAERHGHIDFYNATDYAFQTLHGPSKRVLDFGPGYGRQAFLWTTQNPSLVFVAVDGIEGPYLLQSRVYETLPNMELIEYLHDPDGWALPASDQRARTLGHLPTWRLDLLPDHYFDLIICVQVLQELPIALVGPLLDQFRRVMGPAGRLYIRDHEEWQPAHDFPVGTYLAQSGWNLIYRHGGVDKQHIHGIPRIWVVADSRD